MVAMLVRLCSVDKVEVAGHRCAGSWGLATESTNEVGRDFAGRGQRRPSTFLCFCTTEFGGKLSRD